MSTRLTTFAYRVFGAAVAFFTFCTYPIALIPYRFGGGDSYYMRLPALLVLTCLSVPILLVGLQHVQRRWRLCLTVLAVAVTINLLRQPADWQRTVGFIGYLSVPLAMALYSRQAAFRWSRTVVVLAGLWLLLMIYGFDARTDVVGIAGNRNWMAICLLATAPWGAIAIYALCRGLRRRAWRLAIAAVAISPVLLLIHRCLSRAAWVALVCYLLFAGVSRLRPRVRLLVLALIVIIGGSAAIANHERVVQIVDKDIRIPVWEAAAQLAADHPVVGVGPGRFVNVYAEYLTTSSYHRRAVASETIAHPHNEFLNIAANIGIPAALAWLIALLPLLRLPRGAPAYVQIAHFSAFVIYLHAMLDKPLVQPPSSIIALCCLGLLYSRCVLAQTTTADDQAEPATPGQITCQTAGSARRWGPALFAVVVVFSLWHTIDMIRLGWMQRGAAHYDFAGDYDRAFDCYDAVTRIAPRRIDGWYGCGAIAIEKFMDPKRALPYLEKAQALDSNYAHLNRFLGQAHGTMRQLDTAVRYFARDYELHPFDPDTIQYYFMALERNGPPYTELHVLDRRLKRLPSQRSGALPRKPTLPPSAWLVNNFCSKPPGFLSIRCSTTMPRRNGPQLLYTLAAASWTTPIGGTSGAWQASSQSCRRTNTAPPCGLPGRWRKPHDCSPRRPSTCRRARWKTAPGRRCPARRCLLFCARAPKYRRLSSKRRPASSQRLPRRLVSLCSTWRRQICRQP